MGKLFNRVQVAVASAPGTGVVTLGSAASGKRTFAQGGALNNDVVSYVIEENATWEIGTGTYSSTGPTLTRDTIIASSTGGTAVNFGANAVVMCDMLKEDFYSALFAANNLSDVANAGTARTNLGLTSMATITPGTNVAAALAIALNTAGGLVGYSALGSAAFAATTAFEAAGAVSSHASLQTGVHGISITSGKTLSSSNTLTLAGTDGSTLNIGTGGTLGTAAYTAATAYEASGAVSSHASLQTGVHGISITAAKTLSVTNSLTLSGTDSTTMTFPSTSATLAGLGIANTFTANQTISGAGLILSGNISAPAWTTSGILYANVSGILTDTSSSGTVSTAYTNVFNGNVISASNVVTFTDYFAMYVREPAVGANVTFTNKWALGLTGNLKITGSSTVTTAETIGVQQTTQGSLILANTAAGAFATTIKSSNSASAAWTLTLPPTAGTNNFVLQTDGNGVTSWVAPSGGGTPGGSSLSLQYNNSSAFAGMSGTSWDDTNRSLTLTGATVTTDNPILNLTQTWNAAGVAFTGIKVNVTDTASAAGSLLLDLEIGGVSKCSVTKAGLVDVSSQIYLNSNFVARSGVLNFPSSMTGFIGGYDSGADRAFFYSGVISGGSATTRKNMLIDANIITLGTAGTPTIAFGEANIAYISKPAAATLQFGVADAAAPVAQSLRVQSVVAGTSNTAGVNWTRRGSLGTGTGGGGNIIEQTGFAGASGTAQNTAVDRNIIVGKGKALTDNVATSLFEVALPTLAMCGGIIEATVICTDGTDMQVVSNEVSYAAVNKGGVYTTDIDVAVTSTAVSAGTLANTWSVLAGTNKVTIQLSSDTSLTPTKFLCYYTVRNNSEQATTVL